MTLKAPFPWFGGKSRAAHLVWAGFGDVANYVEPFAGSLAVLLGRPTAPRIETVNDLDCVAPETRMLRADLSWAPAGGVKVGDELLGFDEDGDIEWARAGLLGPGRCLAVARVTGVRRIRKPSYRLTFSDGTTVVASANHLWLGGSHASGGRGWRWVKTENMVCNRENQRSWVLKVCDVVEREESFDAGWLSGLFDGEGSLNTGPGLRATLAQNEGPVLERAAALLRERGIGATTSGPRRCKTLSVTGGKHEQLAMLMRLRPQRLVKKFKEQCGEVSLYGREHRAVALVKKEFLGEVEVMAIETDTHTFIAEGLASHNCFVANFWRAVKFAPDEVAAHADWPVNEADLHARHRDLVTREEFRRRMKREPKFFDAEIAGWWVWGICQWIGGGWCASSNWEENAKRPRGIHTAEEARRPQLHASNGVHSRSNGSVDWEGRAGASRRPKGIQLAKSSAEWNQIPNLRGSRSAAGVGIHASGEQTAEQAKIPMIAGKSGQTGRGIHASGLPAKLPLLSGGAGHGVGVHNRGVTYGPIHAWMLALAERLRRVRVCCGDWRRVLGPSSTVKIGTTGVLLDPPYLVEAGRDPSLYAVESATVAHDVREWAIENGRNPKMRIALCGYEGEHAMPRDWECVAWKAGGGYAASAGNHENAHRERIWFSPGCQRVKHQRDFFEEQQQGAG